MECLDLHGIKHENARNIIEDFILLHSCPMEIITGNSLEMQKFTKEVLDKYKLYAFHKNFNNIGSVVVVEL